MSILAPHVEGDVPPGWVGLIDARMSGWFIKETDELFRGFKISAQDKVLDVGCGEGTATLFCAERGAHVIFSDIDADCINTLEAKIKAEQAAPGGYQGIVCNSDPLLVPDGCASRIICREVLEHVADPGQVMAELARAGQPGSLYLLSVPGEKGEQIQKSFAPADYFEHPNHIRIFSRTAFEELVLGAGLEVIEYTSAGFFWTFWASVHWAIAAAEERAGGAECSVDQDPFSPPFDDTLQAWATLWLKLISTPEGETLKSELDGLLPKSQIIIARKPE